MRKLGYLVNLIIIALCMPIAVASVWQIGSYLGLRRLPVPVVGTGSMYPSLFWEVKEGGPDDESKMSVEEYRTTPSMYRRFPGISVLGKSYLRRGIGEGDMVAFQSQATRDILTKDGKDPAAGFIKRVVGIPGDRIELRDGYVYRNGQVLSEPYIYRPRSTYGDTVIKDCTIISVPEHKYVVLGDNRKISQDSRSDLGLIDDGDISYVLPLGEQKVYESLWRDTSKDSELSGTPTLDSAEFYSLVNKVRTGKGLGVLKSNKLLTASSTLKGNQYLAGNEKYSLEQSMTDAGYHNIVAGEFVSNGHYTADELLQNILAFGSTSKLLLNGEFQDIGVAAVTKSVNGCPAQVIIGHLGGYKPASYDAGTVDSWKKLVGSLEGVIPSWEKARDYDFLDQSKVNELLAILHRRLDLAREVVGVMSESKWLTPDQESRIKNDDTDARRADTLITELNNEATR